MTIRFKRHSINLDDASYAHCVEMADRLATSLSGVIRIIIKGAWERQHPALIPQEQCSDRSWLQL